MPRDDHYPIRCGECGERPSLVRLGSKKPAEHASWGVECACIQSDGQTPVGSFVELNNLPDSWEASADA
jgi:hypothetical protein